MKGETTMYYEYIDDSIAMEGLADIGKTLWVSLQNIFKKIITFLRNIAKNLYYLKTSFMPKQMSEDLQILSQSCVPRYEGFIKIYGGAMKLLKLENFILRHKDEKDVKKLSHDIDCQTAEILGGLESVDADMDSILHDVKESEEYARVSKKEYDFSESIEVPLSNVIPSIKNAEKEACRYDGLLNKLKLIKSDSYHPKIFQCIQGMKIIYSKLIDAYKMQQEILNVFLEYSKASASALRKNIKDRKDQTVVTTIDKYKSLPSIYITSFGKKIPLTLEFYEKMRQYTEDLCNIGHDITQYNRYKSIYNEIANLIKVPTNSTILYEGSFFSQMKYEAFSKMGKKKRSKVFHVLPAPKKSIRLTSNAILYHTSTDPDLDVLTGRFMFLNKTHPELDTLRLFPTPRVYASIGHPMDRDGDLYTGKNRFSFDTDRMCLYKLEGVRECYRDGEFMNMTSAVYVEAYRDIPVTRIDDFDD